MSAQTYTVEAVTGQQDKPDRGHGPMQSIYMNLAGVGAVEWYTKATTAPPAPGSELFGVVEGGQYGKKFKKAQQQGFNGGGGAPRPEDPKRAARILRQHSQDMALRYCQLQHERGKLPEDFKLGDLVGIVDWFDRDAEAAAQ